MGKNLENVFLLQLLDVDECLSSPCPVECINSPGSFTCLCPFGYEFNDNVCKGNTCKNPNSDFACFSEL